MRKNLSVMAWLALSVLIAPLQAIAQTQQQPTTPPQNYYGPGPWHMWGYYDGGWPFWGMFPMMLLFLILFFVVIFFFARGSMGARQRGLRLSSHRIPASEFRLWQSAH